MSVIEHRKWEIKPNTKLFSGEQDLLGVVQMRVTPFLMAQQTVGFLYEKLAETRKFGLQLQNQELQSFFDVTHIKETDQLVIQKVTSIPSDVTKLDSVLRDSLDALSAISLCVDFPLNCYEIICTRSPSETNDDVIFSAVRSPIGRGIGFEIEERGVAGKRLSDDYGNLRNLNHRQKAAQHHYLNGLTLLGLEDTFSGLIDAAFMQFYQACEILCGENFKLDKVKQFIAYNYPNESNDLQVIAHHVWQIRHSYFGHGNAKNHRVNLGDMEKTFNVAKQVLVARWLCKKLLDLSTNSSPLAREMRLYHSGGSIGFFGTKESLSRDFYTGYRLNLCHIVNPSGKRIGTFKIGK
ncbi:hypothetical protein C1M56_02920 [Vibrio diazotrophicus]|nr:hypothetical protein C1M56_02920 [Vibrio diazotrophicus]